MGEIDLKTFNISKKAFDEIIKTAIGEIEGISATRKGAMGFFTKRRKGIQRIDLTKKDAGFTLDIHISIDYGALAYEVAQKVQESVARTLSSMLKMEIEEINIFIDGVNPTQ